MLADVLTVHLAAVGAAQGHRAQCTALLRPGDPSSRMSVRSAGRDLSERLAVPGPS